MSFFLASVKIPDTPPSAKRRPSSNIQASAAKKAKKAKKAKTSQPSSSSPATKKAWSLPKIKTMSAIRPSGLEDAMSAIRPSGLEQTMSLCARAPKRATMPSEAHRVANATMPLPRPSGPEETMPLPRGASDLRDTETLSSPKEEEDNPSPHPLQDESDSAAAATIKEDKKMEKTISMLYTKKTNLFEQEQEIEGEKREEKEQLSATTTAATAVFSPIKKEVVVPPPTIKEEESEYEYYTSSSCSEDTTASKKNPRGRPPAKKISEQQDPEGYQKHKVQDPQPQKEQSPSGRLEPQRDQIAPESVEPQRDQSVKRRGKGKGKGKKEQHPKINPKIQRPKSSKNKAEVGGGGDKKDDGTHSIPCGPVWDRLAHMYYLTHKFDGDRKEKQKDQNRPRAFALDTDDRLSESSATVKQLICYGMHATRILAADRSKTLDDLPLPMPNPDIDYTTLIHEPLGFMPLPQGERHMLPIFSFASPDPEALSLPVKENPQVERHGRAAWLYSVNGMDPKVTGFATLKTEELRSDCKTFPLAPMWNPLMRMPRLLRNCHYQCDETPQQKLHRVYMRWRWHTPNSEEYMVTFNNFDPVFNGATFKSATQAVEAAFGMQSPGGTWANLEICPASFTCPTAWVGVDTLRFNVEGAKKKTNTFAAGMMVTSRKMPQVHDGPTHATTNTTARQLLRSTRDGMSGKSAFTADNEYFKAEVENCIYNHLCDPKNWGDEVVDRLIDEEARANAPNRNDLHKHMQEDKEFYCAACGAYKSIEQFWPNAEKRAQQPQLYGDLDVAVGAIRELIPKQLRWIIEPYEMVCEEHILKLSDIVNIQVAERSVRMAQHLSLVPLDRHQLAARIFAHLDSQNSLFVDGQGKNEGEGEGDDVRQANLFYIDLLVRFVKMQETQTIAIDTSKGVWKRLLDSFRKNFADHVTGGSSSIAASLLLRDFDTPNFQKAFQQVVIYLWSDAGVTNIPCVDFDLSPSQKIGNHLVWKDDYKNWCKNDPTHNGMQWSKSADAAFEAHVQQEGRLEDGKIIGNPEARDKWKRVKSVLRHFQRTILLWFRDQVLPSDGWRYISNLQGQSYIPSNDAMSSFFNSIDDMRKRATDEGRMIFEDTQLISSDVAAFKNCYPAPSAATAAISAAPSAATAAIATAPSAATAAISAAPTPAPSAATAPAPAPAPSAAPPSPEKKKDEVESEYEYYTSEEEEEKKEEKIETESQQQSQDQDQDQEEDDMDMDMEDITGGMEY